MIKVKIIQGVGYDDVTNRVNDFIADKKVVDIQYEAVTYDLEYGPGGVPVVSAVNDRVLIVYEEKEDERRTDERCIS